MAMHQTPERALWYTLGPSSLGKERDLLTDGATGVRLTFGFGTTDLHYQRATLHKKLSADLGRECLNVADLSGEKYRVGTFDGHPTITVESGGIVKFIHADVAARSLSHPCLPVPNAGFFAHLTENTRLIVGDGAVLRVTRASGDEAYAEMMETGNLNQGRGITIQSRDFRPQSLTPKDRRDLAHILATPEYDVVAISFVSGSNDIVDVKKQLESAGRRMAVLAKIETSAGLENIKSICQVADIVMAARGDLALSIPWTDLPDAVDVIASAANSIGTPWILATQIVEGLEQFAIPTRAEICDLAHWLQRGCAGVLLSTETAFGSRPRDAVSYTAAMLEHYRNRHDNLRNVSD